MEDDLSPVAWRFKSDDPNYDDTYVYCATEKMALLRCPKNSEVEPLYTHPASPPVGGAVELLTPRQREILEAAIKLFDKEAGAVMRAGAARYVVDDWDDLKLDAKGWLEGALASSERSGREVALIEAAEELLEHMDDYGHIGSVDVLPLRDAVAAIRNLAGTKTNERTR